MMNRKSAGSDDDGEERRCNNAHSSGVKLYLNHVDSLPEQSFTIQQNKHSIKYSNEVSGDEVCMLPSSASGLVEQK